MLNRLLYLRTSQLDLNNLIIEQRFNFPIHLGLGAEGIALIVEKLKKTNDLLSLTHRNIHHNLLYRDYSDILRDFNNKSPDFNNYGSMNLHFIDKGLFYTSSILANAVSISTGAAIKSSLTEFKKNIFVSIGDGAIEEGSFYESINIASFMNLPLIYIIEDNGMSMSSEIQSRRINFSIEKIASIFNVDYFYIDKNNMLDFYKKCSSIKFIKPTILHFKYKLFCNHAGATPGWPTDEKKLKVDHRNIFDDYENDPLFIFHK